MADETKRLAINIETENEQSKGKIEELSKTIDLLKQQILDLIGTEEKSTEVAKKSTDATTQQSKAQEQSAQSAKKADDSQKSMAKAVMSGGVAAAALTQAFGEVVKSMDGVSPMASQLMGSFGRVAQSLFSMGPAAAAATIAIEAVQYIIKACKAAAEELANKEYVVKIVSDTSGFKLGELESGLKIVQDGEKKITTEIDEQLKRAPELEKFIRIRFNAYKVGRSEAEAWSMAIKDANEQIALGTMNVGNEAGALAKIVNLSKQLPEYAEKRRTIEEQIVVDQNNSYDKQQENIKAQLEGNQKLSAQEELRDRILADNQIGVIEKDKLSKSINQDILTTKKEIATAAQQAAEAGTQAQIKADQITLKSLQQTLDFEDDITKKKQALQDLLNSGQIRSLEVKQQIGDQIHQLDVQLYQKDKALQEKNLATQKQFQDALLKNTLTEKDYELKLLDEKAQAYREAGVNEIELAQWVAQEKKKITDKANAEEDKSRQEQEAKNLASSQDMLNIAWSLTDGIKQAKDDATNWAIEKEKEYGEVVKGSAEMRKMAEIAAGAKAVEEALKAEGRQYQAKAIAYAIGSFTDPALLPKALGAAAVATALGVSAAVAGSVAKSSSASVESMQEQESARLEANKRAREEAERAKEEEKIKTPAIEASKPKTTTYESGGGKTGASVINITASNNLTIYGPVGIPQIEEWFADMMSKVIKQGKVKLL